MKFKLNKIAINDSPSNLLFLIITIVLGVFLIPISVVVQVICIINQKYLELIIADSIIMGIIILFALYMLFKCTFSSISFKKDFILIQKFALYEKKVAYEDCKEIVIEEASKTNILANELWGNYIYVKNTKGQTLFKFSFDNVALENLENRIKLLNIQNENHDNLKPTEDINLNNETNIKSKENLEENNYEKYYQKIKNNQK